MGGVDQAGPEPENRVQESQEERARYPLRFKDRKRLILQKQFLNSTVSSRPTKNCEPDSSIGTCRLSRLFLFRMSTRLPVSMTTALASPAS